MRRVGAELAPVLTFAPGPAARSRRRQAPHDGATGSSRPPCRCSQPGGDAYVTIERPGNHVLVLSAYEQTDWHVTLAPGATVQAITLIGYEAQTVDLPGVPVTHDTGCGYSYPYNGGGCDTNVLLQLAESHAGASLTSFHGCYQAAILCGSPSSYKLYMSQNLDEPFLEIADYAGHGQDHCELVNPAFTIPNEDDITSGGCTTCSVGPLVDPIGVPVYARSYFGQPFQRVTSTFWADLTTTMYSCGVAIP